MESTAPRPKPWSNRSKPTAISLRTVATDPIPIHVCSTWAATPDPTRGEHHPGGECGDGPDPSPLASGQADGARGRPRIGAEMAVVVGQRRFRCTDMTRPNATKTSSTMASHHSMAPTAHEAATAIKPSVRRTGVMYRFCQATDFSRRVLFVSFMRTRYRRAAPSGNSSSSAVAPGWRPSLIAGQVILERRGVGLRPIGRFGHTYPGVDVRCLRVEVAVPLGH